MEERERRRTKHVSTAYGAYRDYWANALWQSSDAIPRTFAREQQLTFDELHDWPAPKGEPVVVDRGGPFHTIKASLSASWDLGKSFSLGTHGGYSRAYDGQILPNLTPYDWQLLTPGHDSATFRYWDDSAHGVGYLNSLGAKAIEATIPTNPHADAAVGVAELFREGFPSLIGSSFLKDRTAFFKNIGGEYLNYEFGWKPFVSDILEIAQSISDSEELLQQLARDSGKNVRRRISFPVERDTTYGRDQIALGSVAPLSLINNVGGRDVTDLMYHRTWFSGAYTYHYDPAALNEASRIATQARHLLGLRIDPEVLWNLTPWSWLVDWFVNLGPVIHNLSAFQQDGLVLRYGYLMHHSTRRCEHVYRNVTLPYGGNFPTGDSYATFRVESKRRIRATPYGFGVSFSSFSTRQFAILGALGITRVA